MDAGKVAAAERVLGASLTDVGGIERGRVARFAVDGGPDTVIVKYCEGEPGTQFWNEWASVEFLTGLPGGPPGTARFLGADGEAGVIVVEDLGQGPSLAHMLLGTDRQAAERALEGWVDALARVHVTSARHIEEYKARQGAQVRPRDINRDPRDRIASLGTRLGAPVPKAVRTLLHTAAERLDDAAAFDALTMGDCCPDNNRIADDGTVRLFDFEWCSSGHVLSDASFIRATMPTCWCVRRLPRELQRALAERYRTILTAAIPETGERYGRDLALATLWMLTIRLSRELEWQAQSDDWGGRRIEAFDFQTLSGRQDAFLRLDLLIELGEESDELTPVADWATQARSALRTRWGDVPAAPVYPAFGGPPPSQASSS